MITFLTLFPQDQSLPLGESDFIKTKAPQAFPTRLHPPHPPLPRQALRIVLSTGRPPSKGISNSMNYRHIQSITTP